jgi:hypothetical protein
MSGGVCVFCQLTNEMSGGVCVCCQLTSEMSDGASSAQIESSNRAQKKVEDVLIKTVRIVANVSISEDIGRQVACSDSIINLLMQILGENTILESTSIGMLLCLSVRHCTSVCI